MKIGLLAGAMACLLLPAVACAQERIEGDSGRQEGLWQERLQTLGTRDRGEVRQLYDLRQRSDIHRQERRARQAAPGIRSKPANGNNTRGSVVQTQ